MMQPEFSTRAVLHQAISLLERIYEGGPQSCPFALPPPPHATVAFRMALRSAVNDKTPTALVTESFSPDQAALHLLLVRGLVSGSAVLAANIDARGFDRMTQAAAQLANAPLFFLAADPPAMQRTTRRILHLIVRHGLQTIVAEGKTAKNLAFWELQMQFLSALTRLSVHLFSPPASDAADLNQSFGQPA